MRKVWFIITPLLLLSLAGMQAAAAAPETAAGRTPTVTRLIQVFMQLETKLVEVLDKRDEAEVAKLLADNFEMRVGAQPGSPIPRADWIRQSLEEPALSRGIEQMAVHDYGKLAVVSYAWKEKTGETAEGHDLYIVDIWTRERNDWKLAVRYAGPAGTSDIPIPGASSLSPAFDKKE